MSANFVPSTPSDVGAAGLTGPTFSAAVPTAVLGGNLAPPLADWTPAGGASWTSPNMTIPSGGSVSCPVAVTSGKTYQIEVTRSASSGGNMVVSIGAASISVPSWDTKVVTVIADATGTLTCTVGGGTWVATVQAITVKEVTAFATASLVGGVGELRAQGTNTGLGSNALSCNITGINNIGIGYRALYVSTIGNSNTAVGYNALSANTTGNRNTAVGHNALSANTTANENTALGYSALSSNTIGNSNTAVGFDALKNDITGNYNTAVGYNALSSNTVSGNTALGYSALSSSTIGNSNTAVGFDALRNNNGSNNTALGYSALSSNTTGNSNTAVGYNAGRYTAEGTTANTTPTGGTYLGYNVRASADNLTSETVIGYGAVGGGANTVTLGNGSCTNWLPGASNVCALGSAARGFKELYLHDGTDEWKITIDTSGVIHTAKV